MPIKLFPPGTRKNNRHWIARGSVGGRQVEFSTRQTDKGRAQIRSDQIVAEIIQRDPARAVLSFNDAAIRYLAAKRLHPSDRRRIERLMRELGHCLLTEFVVDDLISAARRLCPGISDSTVNREFITPGAAVLHYAADNRWCPYRRIRRMREPDAATRSLRPQSAADLLAAADDPDLRLFLALTIFQGRRASDALQIEGDMLDLANRRFRQKTGKIKTWKWFALHPEVTKILADRAPLPAGRLLRWGSLQSVYHHIKKLCRRTGIAFTPHMGRHSFATWLREEGADLRLIMEAGDWRSVKSVVRYADANLDHVRAALAKIGKRNSK
ncbi:MAG: tyrosine-type recombinase/integrase [Rhodospirillales bacterium]|nr:tyrosine-type recombinase/integrase [Rhodospirillales bacterium]